MSTTCIYNLAVHAQGEVKYDIAIAQVLVGVVTYDRIKYIQS